MENNENKEELNNLNAENRKVTGMLTTNVDLHLSDSHLDWGKWKKDPVAVIMNAASETEIFVACGRANTATGCEGYVQYKTNEGQEFKLYFDNPYSKDNSASITGVSGSVAKYNYSVDYPKTGHNWDAKYTLTKNDIQ